MNIIFISDEKVQDTSSNSVSDVKFAAVLSSFNDNFGGHLPGIINSNFNPVVNLGFTVYAFRHDNPKASDFTGINEKVYIKSSGDHLTVDIGKVEFTQKSDMALLSEVLQDLKKVVFEHALNSTNRYNCSNWVELEN